MMDLNKEAEEYAPIQNQCILDVIELNKIKQEDFISGANSKYVQARIIQAQIDVLKSIRTIHDETCMSQRVTNKIKELQQQLKQLENEYNIRNSN
jgi:endoglucanase Acf2